MGFSDDFHCYLGNLTIRPITYYDRQETRVMKLLRLLWSREWERDSRSVIGIEILREEVPGGEKSFRKWRESIFREHAPVYGSFGRDTLAARHSFLYLHNKPLHLGHSNLLPLFHTPTSLCFSVALYLPTPFFALLPINLTALYTHVHALSPLLSPTHFSLGNLALLGKPRIIGGLRLPRREARPI